MRGEKTPNKTQQALDTRTQGWAQRAPVIHEAPLNGVQNRRVFFATNTGPLESSGIQMLAGPWFFFHSDRHHVILSLQNLFWGIKKVLPGPGLLEQEVDIRYQITELPVVTAHPV